MHDVHVPSGAKITLLGVTTPLQYHLTGNDVEITLPVITPETGSPASRADLSAIAHGATAEVTTKSDRVAYTLKLPGGEIPARK